MIFRTIAVVVAVFSMSSCGDQKGTTGGQQNAEYLLVLKTLDNPFFVSIRDGFQSKTNGLGNLIVRSGKDESDVQGQRTVLRALVTEGAKQGRLKGLAITPASSGRELVPEIKSFRDAGVPVVLIDTAIAKEEFAALGTDYNVLIQSDNQGGGRLAADLLWSKLPPRKLNYFILVLEGAIASDTAAQRKKGFDERVAEIRGGAKISTTYRTANWRREEALKVTSGLLTQNFDGIFAANDEMALGALRSYEALGRKPPPIVGFDATDEALAAAKQGRLAGTIAQDPRRMGEMAAELIASGAAASKKFENVPVAVLTCAPECR